MQPPVRRIRAALGGDDVRARTAPSHRAGGGGGDDVRSNVLVTAQHLRMRVSEPVAKASGGHRETRSSRPRRSPPTRTSSCRDVAPAEDPRPAHRARFSTKRSMSPASSGACGARLNQQYARGVVAAVTPLRSKGSRPRTQRRPSASARPLGTAPQRYPPRAPLPRFDAPAHSPTPSRRRRHDRGRRD